VLEQIIAEHDHRLGMAAVVTTPGTIDVGDQVVARSAQ
jgi:hypothetical protein